MNQLESPKRSHLQLAIDRYSQAYGKRSLKLTKGTFRNWADYNNGDLNRLGEAARDLFREIAATEGILIEDTSSQPQAFPSEIASRLFVSLETVRISIYPLVKIGPSDVTIQNEFYRRLDPRLLNLVVLPFRPNREECESAARIRAEGINIILAAPDDVDALASERCSLNEIIMYKIFRIYLQGGVDADAVFADWQLEKFREEMKRFRGTPQLFTLKQALRMRKEDPHLWLKHPRFDSLRNAVSNSPCVFVVGKSASGKSTLVFDLGIKQESHGVQVFYVNAATLTDQHLFKVGVTALRKLFKTNSSVLLILDDLHCRPQAAKNLLSFLRLLQDTGISNSKHILSAAWPSYFDESGSPRQDEVVVSIQAADIKDSLAKKFGGSASEIRQILDFAGDDLLILRLLLETAKKHGAVTDYSDLAKEIWKERSRGLRQSPFLTRVVLVAATLGQYECDVPELYLRTRTGATKEQLEELLRAKLLLKKGDRYSLPHRSFARLIASYLGKHKDLWIWFDSKYGFDSFAGLVLDYIQFLDPSEVWNVLELIKNSGGIQESSQSQRDAVFIIKSWKSIDELLKKIYEQQIIDPTWGHAISSATFACEALGAVGKTREAKGSIEFVRDVYRLDGNRMSIDVSKLSTALDFEEIRGRMRAEELTHLFVSTYSLETAENLNATLFHENWASGLVLCAEEAIHDLNQASLRKLAESVEARMEEGGYFYPARVPWCTARVLIGLGRCGRNIENSPVVRRAADWLIKPRREGGARESTFWSPGTGTWNNKIETTGLCIFALREVGVPSDNPVLMEATNWLYEQKKEWTDIGSELDGAVAVETHLQMNRDWKEVVEQLNWLSTWAVGQALWMYATASSDKTQEQSCRVAQVAAFLIKAMWSLLRSDLPLLLMALGLYQSVEEKNVKSIARPDNSDLSSDSELSTHIIVRSSTILFDVVLSYAGEDRQYVEQVAKCLKRAKVRLFYDQFEQTDLWGKNLYTHLDEVYRKARFCVMFLSSNYARKAWTSHERQSAQARAFQEHQEYILPVRFDDTEIPGISPLLSYVDGNKYPPNEVCKMIRTKLRGTAVK